MTRRQKRILLVLVAIGAVYFASFIPANLSGAKDANMLSLFEVDEFAQYPHVLGMLTPGDTFYQTVRNFFIYLHYFYGYPFYFFSALAILPLRLIFGGSWQQHTPLIVLVLRQMINILPMLASLVLLVWMQTRFRSWLRSLGLFLLLLTVPVVVLNNLWWHPDSLVFLFVVLTLFFLDRDDLRFGRNFFLAATACGLATGTKHLGLFFVLAIPVYLLWGGLAKRIRWGRMVLLGVLFVLVMAAAVVASNPLLLLPQERAAIIATQKLQLQQTSVGIITANSQPFFANGYPQDLRIHYGEALFLMLAFVALLAGILRPERRRLNVLILAWGIPLTAVIFTFATRRTHYFLPVLLPVFSAFVNVFPDQESQAESAPVSEQLPLSPQKGMSGKRVMRLLPWLYILLILGQLVLFVRTDIDLYGSTLNREATSPAIAFYQQLKTTSLAKLPPDQPLAVFRDWHMYFPEGAHTRVELNWDFPTFKSINDLKPDIILLERANIAMFAKPEIVNQAVDPERMALVHQFYKGAADSYLPGYRLLLTNDYGTAFVSEALFNKYFAPG